MFHIKKQSSYEGVKISYEVASSSIPWIHTLKFYYNLFLLVGYQVEIQHEFVADNHVSIKFNMNSSYAEEGICLYFFL